MKQPMTSVYRPLSYFADIWISTSAKSFFFIEYTVVPSHPYQRGRLLATQRRGEEPLHQSLLQGHGTYWNKKNCFLNILLFLDIYLILWSDHSIRGVGKGLKH